MRLPIVNAVCNSEKNIKSCLDSVICQNFYDIEYLIIDRNSYEITLDIIKKFKQIYPFIKLFSDEDKGIYDTLNKGIYFASRDIIIGFVRSHNFLNLMIKSENLGVELGNF